jgi:bacteriocin biosynthesis cyclodehydratase domain-containing protein
MLRPRIKEFYDVVPEAADRYQIRSSEMTAVLTGVTVRDIFGRILPLLDGSNTLDEIAEKLGPEITPDQVQLILKKLRNSGIIEDTAQYLATSLAPEELDQYRRQMVFFDLVAEAGSPVDYQENLKKAHVTIVGAGELAASLARQLARIGVGRVFGANLDPGQWIGDANQFVSFGVGSIEQEDHEALERAFADERPDLLVIAVDRPEPALVERVNELSQNLGIPLLQCQTNGTEASVGPFVIPRQTACLNCHNLRVTRNLDHYHEYHAWKKWVTSDGKHKRALSMFLPPFTDLVAGMAAIEILKHVSDVYEAETYGKFITINAMTFEVITHQVLRLPRCPSCGNARNNTSFSVWQEV